MNGPGRGTAAPVPALQCFVALRRPVSDLRRSVAFYCDGLGFDVAGGAREPHRARLSLGRETIELIANDHFSASAGSAYGPDVRFQHVAVVASDMNAAFARLQRLAPAPISRGGPQRLPAASGGVDAFKFRDPDGHPVELIAFAKGQGAPRWRAAGERAGPTLGIDHAAISVSDVAASVTFYSSRLGLRLASRQINRGVEQARLDGLASAQQTRVEVVALVTAQPDSPHLELLGYLDPLPVVAPEPARAGAHDCVDLLVWRERPDAAAQPGSGAGLRVVVDPDGHRNGIIQ